MPTLKGEITPGQKDFWDRKKDEIKRQQRLAGSEEKVTNDTMLQGLIDLWMKLEEREQREAGP
tara:strand:+ start:689 stop:877 length:189 start_codon:yes stop_codon:yes gene_type:complete